MTDFVVDALDDTNGVSLTSHTGATGATWAYHPSYTGTLIFQSNGVYAATSSVLAYASGVPDGPEYDVEADWLYVSNVTSIGIAARVNTSVNNAYYVYHLADQWNFIKAVGGVLTNLGSVGAVLTPNQTYNIRLQIRTATKKVFIDGVEVLSSTDNSITVAGRAGIRSGGAGSSSTGKRILNFTASNVMPASLSLSDSDTISSTDTSSLLGMISLIDDEGGNTDHAYFGQDIVGSTAFFGFVPQSGGYGGSFYGTDEYGDSILYPSLAEDGRTFTAYTTSQLHDEDTLFIYELIHVAQILFLEFRDVLSIASLNLWGTLQRPTLTDSDTVSVTDSMSIVTTTPALISVLYEGVVEDRIGLIHDIVSEAMQETFTVEYLHRERVEPTLIDHIHFTVRNDYDEICYVGDAMTNWISATTQISVYEQPSLIEQG